jgi:nitroimidazol reductase NimA-like FMN-containing flavoprotein (pyridoxamine 5'-phosphate oxidase superfamily)
VTSRGNDDLAATVAEILDANRYMTLATSEPDGRPRVSPVYFTHDACRTLYWVSSPHAQHSRNLSARPGVAIVVYDSTRDPAATQAVYIAATAHEVPPEELETACSVAFRRLGRGARAFAPAEVSGPAPIRLYRAIAATHELHIRGSDPVHGRGVDSRLAVPLPPSTAQPG